MGVVCLSEDYTELKRKRKTVVLQWQGDAFAVFAVNMLWNHFPKSIICVILIFNSIICTVILYNTNSTPQKKVHLYYYYYCTVVRTYIIYIRRPEFCHRLIWVCVPCFTKIKAVVTYRRYAPFKLQLYTYTWRKTERTRSYFIKHFVRKLYTCVCIF